MGVGIEEQDVGGLAFQERQVPAGVDRRNVLPYGLWLAASGRDVGGRLLARHAGILCKGED